VVRLKIALVAVLIASPAAAQQCGTLTTCPQVSTPLAGSELLYVVQGGVSKKMTVTQLSAGIGPLVPGTNTISPSTNGGVLYDNAGILGDSETLPTGLTIPSATLTAPSLGVATATSINGVTIGASGGALSIASGKTLTDTSGVGADLLLGATGGGFTAYGGASSAGNVLLGLSAAGVGSFQPYGLTGNSTLVETTTGGLLTASIIPFGTATNQVAEGGVITAAGPIGSATAVPVITYNAAGQLTTVTTAALGTAAADNTGTSGATIPLNNGGFTQSGAAIFSSTLAESNAALPSVVAGQLGLAGGSTSAPTLGANDEGDAYLSTANGLNLIGKGSTYDAALLDSAGGVALGVSTGTLNLVLGGGVTAASLATPSSNIGGALCATTGGVFLYNVGANCYAGGGTAGGSNTQVQWNTSGSLGAITGVTSNGTAMTFADGDAILSGSSSGSSILHAPATGGGAVTFQGGSYTDAALTLTDQTLSGGANLTVYNPSAGAYTVDCGKNPGQWIANTGAFTLTAPSSDGECDLQIENGSGAGAVTFSGFTEGSNTGDALDTTSGHKFLVGVTRIHGTSHYLVSALQ